MTVLLIVMPFSMANAQQNLIGLVVEEVATDSAAAKVGLKVGDRILTYDEQALTSPEALQAAQENTFGKNEVVLQVWRSDDRLTLIVPLGSLGIKVRPELPSAVLQLYEEGKVALQAQRVKEVIGPWEAAAKAAQETGDQAAAAWLQGRIGEVYESQRQWTEVIKAYTGAWELLKKSSDKAAQSRVLLALGRAYQNRNDFASAEKWFEETRKVDIAAGNEMWVGADLQNLGSIAYMRGELRLAQDYFSRSLSIRERLNPDSLPVAASLNSLGIIATIHGDLQAAQEYHTRALAIRERLDPNSLYLAISLNNLGIVSYERGDLQAAQEYHHRSLAISERLAPGSLDVARSLDNLSNVTRIRGDLQTAQEYSSRALAIKERLDPNSLNLAISLNNLGTVAYDRGDLQGAQEYHSRALAIRERLASDSLTAAASLNNLGDIACASGDLQLAQAYHSRALAIKERLAPGSLSVAVSLNNLGEVACARGELQTARDYHHRALRIIERMAPNSLDFADTLTSLGNLAFRERRFTEARSFFNTAVDVVETQRRTILSTESRALFLARHTKPFSGLLSTHLALNDLTAAFATSERARARGLLDLLAERKLDFRADAPADLLGQQEQLDQKRSAAYLTLAKLNPDKEGRQIAELQNELTKYAVQQRELKEQFRRASPRFANLQYPEPLDLTGAQAALDAGTLLLSYYVDEKQTYLFALTKTKLQLFTLPIAETELSRQVAAFYKAVAVLPRRQPIVLPHQLGRKLYATLITPAQALVNQAQRILICPDGPLYTLPFAALVSRSKPTPRYFIDERPLHLIASMTVYAETRKEAKANYEHGPRLLVMGDAVYTKEQAEILERRGELKIEKAITPAGEPEIGELRQRDLKFLVPLPGTRQEVEEIARIFGKAATIKLDQEATETAIRQGSRDYTIFHFAVHGWFDDRIGLNSGLVLSLPELLGRKPTREDNGLLQAWEIIEQLRLQADLVVLSACETGLGEKLRGEGVVGLTRAFQYAGAKSLIASLWGAIDESTAIFMSVFYRELSKGASKDLALRRAMAAVRSNPKWRHPFYWSTFILVGSWN